MNLRAGAITLICLAATTPLHAQAHGPRLRFTPLDPSFAVHVGCVYSEVKGPPKLVAFLQAPDSVGPILTSACDLLAWFGEPSRTQVNPAAPMAVTWFYDLRRDYSFTLVLHTTNGDTWHLARPLVLGFGKPQ
jgi:hypothetical protein